MTRIVRLLAVPATGAGYVEDLAALQVRHVPAGERYSAPGHTPGFRAIREVAEAVSIGLVLETGQVAWGDCVAGPGAGLRGRGARFRTREGLAAIEALVAPALEGRELGPFREMAALVDGLGEAGSAEEGEERSRQGTARPSFATGSRAERIAIVAAGIEMSTICLCQIIVRPASNSLSVCARSLLCERV